MKVVIVLASLLAVTLASYPYGGYYAGAYHYGAPLDHEGRVIDTPEVAAAKAKHFEAHAEARARVWGGYGGGYGYDGYGAGYRQGAYGSYYGGYHLPLLREDGVPFDTPEVVEWRRRHAASHAIAAQRAYGHGYYQ